MVALLGLALATALYAATACDSGSDTESITADGNQVQQSAIQPAEQTAPQTSRSVGTIGVVRARVPTQAGTVAEQSRSVDPEEAQPETDGFVLQLLHASDMDGAVGALDNVETFSALLDGFRAQMPQRTLVLSSGDNFIPGPRFYAAAELSLLGEPGIGRGDIGLLNAMGFQASALGNHEFDLGPQALASIIAPEQGESGLYSGAAFPYLSANLGLADDPNLLPLVEAGSLASSLIIDVDGEPVGIVGATTPHLAWISSAGEVTVEPADGFDLDALAAIIQGAVDDLAAQGIDKIILLAHMQQIEIELQLAGRLRHVDIIVAGGSNTLLADETDRLRPGDRAIGQYPLHMTSASGEPMLLVNTDADYRYLGRLIVRFDGQGRILRQSIDPSVSGIYATDEAGRAATATGPIGAVSQIVEALRSKIRDRDGEVVARTGVYLAGRRGDVRTQETNLGNLVADAMLWTAQQIDPRVAVALKNSGGIRDHIGHVSQPPGTTRADQIVYSPPAGNPASGKRDGEITRFDIESVLRFNNGLVIVPLTARELVTLMEHAIGFDGVGSTPDGRFPQVAGMRFSFDPGRPPGERIQSLAVVDDSGAIADPIIAGGALVGNPNRVIRMAALNFTANGGDGYPFPQPALGRVDLAGEAGQYNPATPEFPDTNGNGVIDAAVALDRGLFDFAGPGTEQDALAEYLARFYGQTPFNDKETPPSRDRRIQNLAIAGTRDTVYESTAP
ncbi:MAG: bifunctional metallophosphatase/5'-nucleotidase [Chloroflexota bacterium]|nr:bifunctional metallophosphatase/5'-nucleotidase [Chloroflexota bacterium]MDE2896428.1 bifunctional metallophosphatase/5'-nucleotidase [Chloroflexota bacterium]